MDSEPPEAPVQNTKKRSIDALCYANEEEFIPLSPKRQKVTDEESEGHSDDNEVFSIRNLRHNILVIHPNLQVETIYCYARDAWMRIPGLPGMQQFDTATVPYQTDASIPFNWSHRHTHLGVNDSDTVFLHRLSGDPDLERNQLVPFDGPLFITIGRTSNGHPVSIPSKLRNYIHNIITGHKFLKRSPVHHLIDKMHYKEKRPGTSAITITSIFPTESFRTDGCTLSTTVLSFASMSRHGHCVIGESVQTALYRAVSEHGRGIGQIFGSFFEFLGSRRAPYSRSSVHGFLLEYKDTLSEPTKELFTLLVSDLGNIFRFSHRFFLLERIFNDSDCGVSSTGCIGSCGDKLQRAIVLY